VTVVAADADQEVVDVDSASVPDDTTPELTALAGSGRSATARVLDGVFTGSIESINGGAFAFGTFTDTFVITSATLPAGASVELQVELEYSTTLSPNGVAEPCVTFTQALATAALDTGSGFVEIGDSTCDALDYSNLTLLIQRQVGDEFPMSLRTELNGFGVDAASGSLTARMYVTPLGEADYITASGNDYRRPVDVEPTVEELLEDLVQAVADLNLQAGITNALDAKLDAARNALDDVNENNDIAAMNSLHALINNVEAQRGNKLTDEQGDMLIAAALAIIAAIQSGGG
jgi:hypothetical protein